MLYETYLLVIMQRQRGNVFLGKLLSLGKNAFLFLLTGRLWPRSAKNTDYGKGTWKPVMDKYTLSIEDVVTS